MRKLYFLIITVTLSALSCSNPTKKESIAIANSGSGKTTIIKDLIRGTEEATALNMNCSDIFSGDLTTKPCGVGSTATTSTAEVAGKNCSRVFRVQTATATTESQLTISLMPHASLAMAKSSFNFSSKDAKYKNQQTVASLGDGAFTATTDTEKTKELTLVFLKGKHLVEIKSINANAEDDGLCLCYAADKLTNLATEVASKLP